MRRVQLISRLIKPLLFVLCLIPFGVLVWGVYGDELGANPVETITHQTGLWALRLLLITLSVTPLCRFTGWKELVRLRRMLGLYVFFYALLHFLTYAWLDQAFVIGDILQDVVKRPYITLGFSAFLMLIPLAATSTNGMIKRLGGKRWQQLHRLVYPCAMAAVLHYLWLVKADIREPMSYLVALTLLLILRLPGKKPLTRPAGKRQPAYKAVSSVE